MKVMGRMLSLNGGDGIKAKLRPEAAVAAPPAAKARGLRQVVASRLEDFRWLSSDVDSNPARRIGFLFGLAFLFARFSYVGEGVGAIFGVPIYANYWTALPAIVAVILCGGLARSLGHRGAILIMLFAFWMVLAVPTSFWPGGSFARVKGYLQFELPMLIILGGLAANWDDVRKIFATLAWSGISVLLLTRVMGKVSGSRLSLDFDGTIANSNDLAAHLLLLLPFFVFMVIDKKRFFFIRLGFVAAIGYALYVILGTASRGALVALACGGVFVMLRASARQKMALLALLPLLAVGAVALLPERTLGRLGVLGGKQDEEAEESGNSRSYLFEQSIIFTLKHPLLGVGPSQFSNYEGNTRVKEGQRGNWHETHCSWTQVSSECGIPALIFYSLAIFLPFLQVNRAYKVTRQMKWTDGSNACFCFLLAMVLYLVAITFLSTAYTYRQPAMIAIGFVMSMSIGRIVSAQAARRRQAA